MDRARQIIKRFLKLVRKRALQIYAKILQSDFKDRLITNIKAYKKLAIKYIRKVTDKTRNVKGTVIKQIIWAAFVPQMEPLPRKIISDYYLLFVVCP